ncbi:MAG: HNH endonuclease [Acidimicrobiales bacterium]|nr:MAG: HNH endonuclease [Acidimicrobiales bacterium]
MATVEQGNRVAAAFANLHAALDQVAQLSLTFLPVDQLNTAVVETMRVAARIDGMKAVALSEADAAGLAGRHGERSLTTHVARETRGCPKAIGPDRTMGLWLRDFPKLADALCAGTITRQHVVELKGIDNKRVHGLMVRDQHLFLQFAQDLQWAEWGQAIGYWLNAADPDGEDTDPSNPKYGLTTREWKNGDVTVTMRLDPVSGEAFLTMCDHETQKRRRAEADSPDGVRTPLKKLQLQAMMRLLVRGFQREDGSTPVPLVNLVMSEKLAEDLLARVTGCESPSAESPLDINPFELPIAWDDIDGRCETIRGTPVHPKHALWLLLIGNLRRTVMTADNQVLNLGRSTRLFTKPQRNALLVQSRGRCVERSCTNPYPWLQADHVHPWTLGGLTDLANGAIRCQPHNNAKGAT